MAKKTMKPEQVVTLLRQWPWPTARPPRKRAKTFR
jgi:hypothetical protein